jgi:hypothetical protein
MRASKRKKTTSDDMNAGSTHPSYQTERPLATRHISRAQDVITNDVPVCLPSNTELTPPNLFNFLNGEFDYGLLPSSGYLPNSTDFSWEPECLGPRMITRNDGAGSYSGSSTPSRDKGQSHRSETCQCTASALSLLETVTTGDMGATLSGVPNTLRVNKAVLSQCKRLLGCDDCRNTSTFMTLLILLCEKTATSYQHVIERLTEQFDKLYPRHGERAHSVDVAILDSRNENRPIVKDYEIDVEEEPCMFGGLVTLQLGIMVALLAKVKTALICQSWTAHIALLETVEKKVSEQVRTCTAPCEVN